MGNTSGAPIIKSALALLAALALLMLPLAVIAAFLLRDVLDPPWQAVRASYCARSRSEPLVLKQAVRAARPDLFTRSMSRLTYGNAAQYQVDVDSLSVVPNHNARPLPYPPDELWCVVLAPAGGGTDAQIVFLARHVDEYTGQWAVHLIGDGEASQPAQVLTTVGCDLGLR